MEKPLRFRNRRGLVLAADLLRPPGAGAFPAVVFAHGWGSSRRSGRNRRIAEALREEGIAALLLDFTGHGDSEGRLDEVTLDDQIGDLHDSIDLLAGLGDLVPVGVAGSSSGGAVAVAEAADDPRVAALVLRAPSADTDFGAARRISAPTLLVQGARDPLLERNRRLVEALACEHRLLVVPGAGHLFEEPGTFDAVVSETVGWFRRWLANDGRASGGQRLARNLRIEAGASAAHFADRAEAGRELARRLEAYRGARTLVLGLPRGGVAVADPIARALGCELDVLVSRKLRAPSQPELAIGAVAEGDVVLWNEDIVSALGLTDPDRDWELRRTRRELAERVAAYRAAAPRAEIKDRTVILVDDGVATGATLKAALEALQREGPARVVIALPGGPKEMLEEIARIPGVHEVLALAVPEVFWAVGQLYDSFAQVSDEEVGRVLRSARQPPPAGRAERG